MLMLLAATASGEDGDVPRRGPGSHYTGLSVFAGAAAIWADNNTANFFSGRPDNANTINRVLHSNTYGTDIWNRLVRQGLISPSAIGNYSQLTVAEYPEMSYRVSYQMGVGLRYDYASRFGWLLRVDVARLNATGAFNLSSTNGTGILSQTGQYIRCGVAGRAERINIDFAVLHTYPLSASLDVETDLGFNLNNIKVKENLIEVEGTTYSILDRWGGRTPDDGVGEYDYINQGGVGIGGWAAVWVGYAFPSVGAIRAGYTLYRHRTVLEGYSAWGWSHLVGLRFEMNNFSFFD